MIKIKTGMLSTEEVIETVGSAIADSGLDHVVIDPVMVCKGEDEVLNPGTVGAMIQFLLPKAEIVTPNLFEAGQLAGAKTPKTIEDMKSVTTKIYSLGARNVVIKGGKQLEHEKAVDLFYDGKTFTLLEAEKTATPYNHGAGCTFAAAITANLANGMDVKSSVVEAKKFVSAAIAHGWKLNEYVGPVMHGAKNQFEAPEITLTEV